MNSEGNNLQTKDYFSFVPTELLHSIITFLISKKDYKNHFSKFSDINFKSLMLLPLSQVSHQIRIIVIKFMKMNKNENIKLSDLRKHDCVYALIGSQSLLLWAKENNFTTRWTENTCSSAALGGQLMILKWLKLNGCEWDSNTCAYAAEKGHLIVLKYARENGCEWNLDTCNYAALNGHLEVLKYARENGCEWNTDTCSYAALNGHLEVLKYARENGCEWNSDTYTYAVLNGHLEVLKYVKENGCEWNPNT